MQPPKIPAPIAGEMRASGRHPDAALLRAATELFVLDAEHDRYESRRFEELALHLLTRVRPEDRMFVAERLASCNDAPRAVICALARDRIEVATPILRGSPVLTPVDLLAAIAATGSQHHCVIASRPSLAPEVKRALRLTEDPEVLARLDRATATEPEPEKMPASGFYYASTTRDPWRFLGLDRRARLRLIAEIASRPPASERISADTRVDRAFRSILGAARIVGFARSGQLPAIINAVAEGLELPADLVAAAANDPSGELLAVMLKALRLDEVQARQVLLLASPAGRDVGAFFPLSDLYAGMEPDVADTIVASWRDAARLSPPTHQPHLAENRERRRGSVPVSGRRTLPDEEARRA